MQLLLLLLLLPQTVELSRPVLRPLPAADTRRRREHMLPVAWAARRVRGVCPDAAVVRTLEHQQ